MSALFPETRRGRLPEFTIGGLLVVIVALWIAYCREKPTPIPEREQHTLDSLDITKPSYVARRDTLVRVESVYIAQSAVNRAGARQVQRAADSLHAVANAAQRLAEARDDTISAWRTVAIVRGEENDSLRAANSRLDSALTHQIAARTAADARASADSSRLYSSEDLNRRLAADFRRADPPCRMLVVARCPSRTTVALIGAGVGYLVSRSDVRDAAARAVRDGLKLILP